MLIDNIMSELLSFIGTKTFTEVKKAAKDLNLDIKSVDNVYMILFNDKCDFQDQRVRQASGMILEKDTNKLLHYSFEKCYDGFDKDWGNLSNDPYSLKNIDDNDYRVELFFEGSIIKLYYYNDIWNIATSKKIESNKNRWSSKKTYDILFSEAIENTYNVNLGKFFETLEKNHCHTFLLQHPENVLTYPIEVPVVYYLNKVNLSTLEEETPEKENLTINKTIDEVLYDNCHNYMIYTKNEQGKIDRVKCLSSSFVEMMDLRGNYPDIGLSYLEKIYKKNLYYRRFPQSVEIFNSIEKLLKNNAYSIFFVYKNIHIFKKHIDIPKRYIRTLSQLHGLYRKTKIYITEEIVYQKLISLEAKILAYVIGYKY